MKKLIFLILFVIATAIPAIPYYIGTMVEKELRIEHTKLQYEAELSEFDIELVDYRRHIFNATATTRITITTPKDNDRFVLELQHHIDHTPQLFEQIIATIDSKLVLNGEAAETLAPLFKGEAPLTTHTRIFFDGHQEGTLYSPAASGQLVSAENATVEWKGLKGTAWQSAQFDKLRLNVSMPKLHLSAAKIDQPNSIGFSDMSYGADMAKGTSKMWSGKYRMDIGSMNANITDKKGINTTINIDTITTYGEQSENNGLAQGSGVIKSRRITINEFSMTDVTYDVAVENIDVKAIMGMQVAMQEMVKESTKPADPMQPLRPFFPALYNAHPVIKINDLSVNSPMGKFLLKMDVSNMGEWDDMLLDNPAMLASRIKANIDASVPRSAVVLALKDKVQEKVVAHAVANNIELTDEEFETAVEQSINLQIAGLIALGYIKVNEEQLEAKLHYNAGQLAINGIDASPLAGMMMQ